MSQSYTVLCFGDSPTCTFVAWRLAIAKWPIITVASKCINSQNETIYWTSQKYSNHDYKPVFLCDSVSQLMNCKAKIDFVLFSADDTIELIEFLSSLENVIDEETIILVDTSYAIDLENNISTKFSNNIVLSILSESIVKILRYKECNIYSHLGNGVATVIGSACSRLTNNTLECLKGLNWSGKRLKELAEILQSNGVFPCTIIQNDDRPSIGSYIWKKIFSFVTFELLSLIYGELNLENPVQNSIMKQTFYDLLNLAAVQFPDEFPNQQDLKDQMFYQLVQQFNQLHSRYKISTSNNVGPSNGGELLDLPFCIYNFSNELSTYAPLCLKQLLDTARKNELDIPYLECINSFYFEIDKLGKQKVFDWVKKTLFETVKLSAVPKSQFSMSQSNIINDTNNKHIAEHTQSSLSQKSHHTENYVSVMPFDEKTSQYYPIPVYHNQHFNFNLKNSFNQHPRFKNLPGEDVNGKRVAYHQIKEMIYPNTKGSTVPYDLSQAHKHIYQYANLNNTFESVNNRYGWSDSLDRFKKFSGIKSEDDVDELEDVKEKKDERDDEYEGMVNLRNQHN